MEECDKRKSHLNSKLHMIYISSGNIRHPVTHTNRIIIKYKKYLRQTEYIFYFILILYFSGFGGAEVACWPLIPKFACSNPAEAVGFLKGDKNPLLPFLRKGSKLSVPCRRFSACKRTLGTYPRHHLAAISAHSSSSGC
jgi:hypothetical protein